MLNKCVRCLRPSLQSQGTTTTHTHPRACQYQRPHARRPSMSGCGNGSHPRPHAKSLQAANSCRGGQEPAGHHCEPSAAVSAPPRCGVMMRKGVARERKRERERWLGLKTRDATNKAGGRERVVWHLVTASRLETAETCLVGGSNSIHNKPEIGASHRKMAKLSGRHSAMRAS